MIWGTSGARVRVFEYFGDEGSSFGEACWDKGSKKQPPTVREVTHEG